MRWARARSRTGLLGEIVGLVVLHRSRCRRRLRVGVEGMLVRRDRAETVQGGGGVDRVDRWRAEEVQVEGRDGRNVVAVLVLAGP